MAQPHVRILSKEYSPAAVGTAETVTVWSLKKGERVLAASLMRIIAAAGATTSTIQLEVSAAAGGANAGLIGATDTEGAVGSLVDGEGADLANSGGILATADGTIDAEYVIGATPGATNPKVRFTVVIERDWPS